MVSSCSILFTDFGTLFVFAVGPLLPLSVIFFYFKGNFNGKIAKIFVRNKIIIYKLIFRWDTAGQEAYEEARRVCYDGTHVVLIGFSVVEPDSLANVENLWAKEAKLEKLRDAPVGQRVSSIIFYFFLFFF